jgi:CRISPR-associated protein Csd1
MLTALVDYANRKIENVETGFVPKEIRWLAGVSPDGRFTGLLSLGGQEGIKRSPDISFSELIGMPKTFRAMGYSIEQASHFLAETCAVVFKLPELNRDGNIKKPDDHSKNLQKHETFKLLMRIASSELSSLEPIYKALADETQMLSFYTQLIEQTQKIAKEKLKVTDKISFFIDGQCLLDRTDWQDWWREFRARAFGKPTIENGETSDSIMLSLVTGKPTEPAKTHLKATKLSGGGAFGLAFVTYDKDAFESYGLKQGENGAVDQTSVTAYRAALDSMLGCVDI